jgi:hypothetical protein
MSSDTHMDTFNISPEDIEQDNHKYGTPLGNIEKSLKWLRSFDY